LREKGLGEKINVRGAATKRLSQLGWEPRNHESKLVQVESQNCGVRSQRRVRKVCLAHRNKPSAEKPVQFRRLDGQKARKQPFTGGFPSLIEKLLPGCQRKGPKRNTVKTRWKGAYLSYRQTVNVQGKNDGGWKPGKSETQQTQKACF